MQIRGMGRNMEERREEDESMNGAKGRQHRGKGTILMERRGEKEAGME
jgi:hypothetical protein